MKAVLRLTLAFAAVSLAALGNFSGAADWPSFRGSNGGVSPEKSLPVKWDASNRLWKVKLPGPGASSPITYGDHVFVTCYSGYGTKLSAGGAGGKGGKGGKGRQRRRRR